MPSYSIGFWVAKTVKLAGSLWVSRSMVTSRSCMAWEEGGLGLGRGAIDFIRKEEGGEDRAAQERELIALEVEDIGAGDVRGHEVGRELDAGEVAAEDMGEGADEEGLGDAGHAFDEGVMAGEDDDERFLDDIVLADDDLADFGTSFGEDFLETVGFHSVIQAVVKRDGGGGRRRFFGRR